MLEEKPDYLEFDLAEAVRELIDDCEGNHLDI